MISLLLTVTISFLLWLRQTICRSVKCFIFIMQTQNSSSVAESGGSNRLFRVSKDNRRKLVHLLSIRMSFKQGPSKHRRWTSFKFELCSNSAKSHRVKEESNRITPNCRQLLIIYKVMSKEMKKKRKKKEKKKMYKEMSSVVLIRKECYLFRIFGGPNVQVLQFLNTDNFVMHVVRFFI